MAVSREADHRTLLSDVSRLETRFNLQLARVDGGGGVVQYNSVQGHWLGILRRGRRPFYSPLFQLSIEER
jgi:hypothetical protein